MVFICIDLRRAKLMNFIEVMEQIGYIYEKLNSKTIQEKGNFIVTHEMIRNSPNTISHLHLQYYRNKLGQSHNNRVKIYGHVDIKKTSIDGSIQYFYDTTESRIQKDITKIRKALKKFHLGYFSYKDAHSVHATLRVLKKSQLVKFEKLILQEFQEIEPGKYRKTTQHRLIHLWLTRENDFMHLVLCAAKIYDPKNELKLEYARQEFEKVRIWINLCGAECF